MSHSTVNPGQSAPQRRPLTRYLAIALILLISPIFALAATVAATGTVTVEIDDRSADGVNLYIPVPALLFDLAVFAAPMVMPGDALAEARQEIAPYREGLEAMAEEIASMPSGVLVDVISDGEHIRITKTWRNFEIEVHGPDTDIAVSVPSRLLSRALDVL